MAYKIKNSVAVENVLTAQRTQPSVANKVPLWVTSTVYAVDDLIEDSTKLYRCSTAHTASALFATDVANWVEISAGSQNTISGSNKTYLEVAFLGV